MRMGVYKWHGIITRLQRVTLVAVGCKPSFADTLYWQLRVHVPPSQPQKAVST